jgi:hypothetical protein
MSLVGNERVKLTANWIHAITAGIVYHRSGCSDRGCALRDSGPFPDGSGDLDPIKCDLARDRKCPTSNRESAIGGTNVTWFQVYAFFISPLLVLAIGLGMYFIAARDLDRPRPKEVKPGE